MPHSIAYIAMQVCATIPIADCFVNLLCVVALCHVQCWQLAPG